METTKTRQTAEPTLEQAGGLQKIFLQEHRDFDHALADVEFLSERRSFVQAAKRFGELQLRLERHLHAEEEILLPLFRQRTGDPDRICARLQREHAELLRLMGQVGAALSQWNPGQASRRMGELDALLKAHHRNEERHLHPVLDGFFPTEEEWRLRCREAHLDC